MSQQAVLCNCKACRSRRIDPAKEEKYHVRDCYYRGHYGRCNRGENGEWSRRQPRRWCLFSGPRYINDLEIEACGFTPREVKEIVRY